MTTTNTSQKKGSTDPFTRTPGVAGKAYIDMHYADRVIDDFTTPESSKYVYKIVGLRGSGKSVVYGKILTFFRSQKEWLVYSLSAAGKLTDTLIAKISSEDFINSTASSTAYSESFGGGGNIGILQGSASVNITKTISPNHDYYSPEAALDEMLAKAQKKGYKVLIGIDDIAKTDEVVKFLSIIGKHFTEGDTSLYLLCTGLEKNIEDFSKEANLTFFKRSDSLEITSLNKYEVAEKYTELLGVPYDKATELAKQVKGYAYAYQVLGSLYFNHGSESEDKILQKFEKILFQDSYDLIWKSLTPAEKELVKIILASSGSVKEIKEKMEKEQNFSVLRDRLAKKHILNTTERGILTIELPRFREFVQVWGD